jgi:hypothetical protein
MGEIMTEKNDISSASLKEQLEKWEDAGIRLYLDGTPTSSESIEKNCVNEDMLYMPDYITDKEGRIKEIRYNKISLD